jgi:hypothetical protein
MQDSDHPECSGERRQRKVFMRKDLMNYRRPTDAIFYHRSRGMLYLKQCSPKGFVKSDSGSLYLGKLLVSTQRLLSHVCPLVAAPADFGSFPSKPFLFFPGPANMVENSPCCRAGVV